MTREFLLNNPNFYDCKELDKMIEIINSPEKSDFYETHHIIPKSAGGTDTKENLVCLSLKQHFLVHYYLTFCTQGQLKRKMCYAFKQMIFTRDSFKEFDFKVIQELSEQYEKLLKNGFFKENYIRTEEIKANISKSVTQINTGKKWCNNKVEEKFVTPDEFEILLENGYIAGRLKQTKISETLKGRTKVSLEDLKIEFEAAIKNKDNNKRYHVNYNGKNFRKTGAQIAREQIPYKLGTI